MGLLQFLGFGRSAALRNRYGRQMTDPVEPLVPDTAPVGIDAAMQIAAVWRAVEIRAKTVASMPLMVYANADGLRTDARGESLWDLMHESPNARQTPYEFWVSVMVNYLLRGNGYAEVMRSNDGTPYAIVPRSADDVYPDFRLGGDDIYRLINSDGGTRDVPAADVLHIKEMSGGLVGISRSAFMRNTLAEARATQGAASSLFRKGGRTTGVIGLSGTSLNPKQWDEVKQTVQQMVDEMRTVSVLPFDAKFTPVNLTPQDIELLTTRQFTVQEIGRWFGVPAVLMNQTEGTTTLGASAEQVIDSFYKVTIRPDVVNIEQSLRKRVMTAKQRVRLTAEFNMDALLRASLKDRMEIYAKGSQNGIYNRNECRAYENLAPFKGGEVYTAQSNLLPIDKLGTQTTAPASQSQMNNIAQ
ncbi:phage portal protein [Methylomonas sp. MED-D]|uniref:phage portal protein n=1 Tax=Methylomonas sp. MED-D TaxID=3418768 RepID=UPI003D00C306